MIKWPQRAKAAIQKLFEPLQDIDVYVEDKNDEVFYKVLLKHVARNDIKVARIFSLGGRDAVIDAAKKHDFSKRKALFIIDGDLYLARGAHPPKINHLHQHDAYCIENLLLCRKAVSTIVSHEMVIDEDEAEKLIDLNSWLIQIEDKLVELFCAFATSQELATGLKTVADGTAKYITTSPNGLVSLDFAKVDTGVSCALAAAEAKAGKERASAIYKRISARVAKFKPKLKIVSGKDFIIPLLDFLLQSHGCRIKRKTLRIRLAASGDVRRFDDLYHALLAASKS